ncbi:MAG: HAD family hydrolase [Gemmatimonadota bacterium]|nr:HAD family hydrolase [Gemmatimonadota bacterium]
MTPLRAVILDVDGTLILSNDAHAQAFVDAALELGIERGSFKEVRRLIGMGSDKLIPRVFGFRDDSAEGEALSERKGEIFRSRYLPELRPAPGARALLERLRGDGLRLVVATSASEEDLEGLLERVGVPDLIEGSSSASEVENSKPAPDVVEAALGEAGCPPEAAVMLGDTPYDVEAAGRAGVRIIGVRCGGWGDEDLRGAVAIFDDPADLLARYDLSPLGGSL